jgi:hypothetical protein
MKVLERPYLNFTWKITEKDDNKSTIAIQIKFLNFLDVSNDNFLDTLEVSINQNMIEDIPK